MLFKITSYIINALCCVYGSDPQAKAYTRKTEMNRRLSSNKAQRTYLRNQVQMFVMVAKWNRC